MLELNLNPDEAKILRDVLEDYLSDLRMEIVDTEDMDFREMLKRKKGVLTKVVESLQSSV